MMAGYAAAKVKLANAHTIVAKNSRDNIQDRPTRQRTTRSCVLPRSNTVAFLGPCKIDTIAFAMIPVSHRPTLQRTARRTPPIATMGLIHFASLWHHSFGSTVGAPYSDLVQDERHPPHSTKGILAN